ncbi:cytochrome P450 [Aspergillus ellipticus CBS 707.79]|uniref:Cytochrome P450 n=1 Tax=Aspergillus ellipticus CBS 707.79 TaxID=1448320 RepID=A0A319DCB7_9EURO|nr:cytochrome P450 [Aspergillus ellipticus CBS 707.79]
MRRTTLYYYLPSSIPWVNVDSLTKSKPWPYYPLKRQAGGCIYLHPLAKYPGPRSSAASRIPITYATVSGNLPFWLEKQHVKYGPVVRVAPDELSYSDPRAWKDIFARHPNRPYGMPREKGISAMFDDEHSPPSIVSATDVDHPRISRAYASCFTKSALSAQEPLILEHIKRLMVKLHEGQNQPVNIGDMFTFLLFDIKADLQFGESLRLLDTAANIPWVGSQPYWIRASVILAALAEFPLIRLISQWALPGFVKTQRDMYLKFSNDKVNHRLQSMDVDRPDFLQLIVKSKEQQGTLSADELRVNAPILMTAGSDTTMALLSGLIVHLMNAPHAHKKVQDEIRTAFRTSEDITMLAMSRLPFVDACLRETLRLYPSVPALIPRVVPQPGAEIAGLWVSGGTRLCISTLATSRSSRHFFEAGAFHPERWRRAETGEEGDGEKEIFSADDKNAFHPFSIGNRSCPGQDMAYYISRMVLCHIVLQFDFESCSETATWFERQRAWQVWHKPPLLIKLIPPKS